MIEAENMSHHKKLSINALSNLFRYLTYVVVTFLLTPITIRCLGESAYGLWVVVLSVVGYAGILEMGVQTAVVKLVAQYHGANDAKSLNQVVGAALAFFTGVGLLVATVFWAILPLFIDLMVADPSGRETVRQLLIILGINVVFVFPTYVFSGMVYGFQVYHLKNLIDVVSVIVNAILVYLLLIKGYGIFALATVKVFGDVVSLAALYLLSRKVFPQLRLSFLGIGKERYKEIFSLGGKIFSSATMVRIAANGEPLIISYALSNAATAVFSIPKRLIDYVKEISWSLTTGFMPMFSQLYGKSDTEGIRRIYLQYTRYLVMLLAPILAAVAVYGTPFISLWIGDTFAAKGKTLVLLLSASFAVECLQPLVWRMFIGVNRVGLLVRVSSFSSLAYLLLAFTLVWKLGINGVALGGLIVSCVCQSIFLIHTARYLQMSTLNYLKECHLMPILNTLVLLALMLWVSVTWPPVSYGVLVLQVTGTLVVYAAVSWLFALTETERLRILDFIRTRRTMLLQEK